MRVICTIVTVGFGPNAVHWAHLSAVESVQGAQAETHAIQQAVQLFYIWGFCMVQSNT